MVSTLLSTGYAFISAYLKGEESRLVTSDHVDNILRTSKIQDALGVIKDTDIGSYLEEIPPKFFKDFDDIEECLWIYFGDCLERLKWFRVLPADILKVLSSYKVKCDVSNVKAALRGILTGKKARMIPVGVIHDYGLLDELSEAETLDSIIELLMRCKLEDYAYLLREHEELINGGLKSRLLAEVRLDGRYYKNIIDVTKGMKDGRLFSKAFGIIIDLTNLQIICRSIIEGIGPEAAEFTLAGGYMITSEAAGELLSLKLSDIPGRLENTQYRNVAEEVSKDYDRTKDITVVEQVIEKHKFSLVKEILSPRVLSPLMIAWYLFIKEIEMRNLRLILKAMIDNLPLEEIRDYLVLSS